MRRSLKILFLIALPVALAVMAVSCTKQENNSDVPVENLTCLRINSVSAGDLSKAAIDGTSFPSDEDISLGLFLEGEGYTDTYKNVKYTRKAGESEWEADPEIILNDKIATVYAYYPYNANIETIEEIPVTSSIDGVDFMWAEPVGEVNKAKPDIDLSFIRALARVEITFNIYGYEQEEIMNEIRLLSEGFSLSGILDAKTGAITTFADKVAYDNPFCPANEFTLSGDKIVVKCLLVPTRADNEANIPQEFYIYCTFAGKARSTYLCDGLGNGVIIRKNTKSTLSLNIRNEDR